MGRLLALIDVLRRDWGAVALGTALSACSAAPGAAVKTNLGPTGNGLLHQRYRQYLAKSDHCRANGTGRRVIVSGFGLFEGAAFNPSGTVVRSFAAPAFQPSTIELDQPQTPAAAGEPRAGRTVEGDYGAIAENRSITIAGASYEMCFLTLDVLWDLAGAIVATEAHTFAPALIIMSGRNADDTAVWEGGAINDATKQSGFHADGSDAGADNTPQSGPHDPNDDQGDVAILSDTPGLAPGAELAMTWDNAALWQATHSAITAINASYRVEAPVRWRTGNDYICNNVSLVALAAAALPELRLAGGSVRLGDDLASTPFINRQTKIGFFHFPVRASNSGDEVRAWIRVLARAIDTELRDSVRAH